MADFDTKFKEMQKYLPFLQNVIEKLRNSTDQTDDNPRMAQLKKMEVLHDLLKTNGKKLKLETLLKCEGLLMKLHSKMERNENEASKQANHTLNSNNTTVTSDQVVSNSSNKVSCVEIVDITGPESPPPQPLEEIQPVEIPTERRCSPSMDGNLSKSDQRGSKYERYNKYHYKHYNRYERHQHDHPTREREYPIQHRVCDNNQYRSRDQSKSYDVGNSAAEKSSVSPNLRQSFVSKMDLNRDNPKPNNQKHNEIYSPEECWDEIITPKSPPLARKTSIDCTSPSPTREQTYHNTIFNFKKHIHKSNEIFPRARNPENCAPLTPRVSSLPGRSSTISIPVKVPTIPEVLKSPPLSASDISDLLSENGDRSTEKSIPSISEIGTRRPSRMNVAAVSNTILPTESTTFDKVRKKFAIVTEGLAQTQDIPKLIKSQASPPLRETLQSLPNERLALKYKPHPRTECSTHFSGNDTYSAKQTDPRLNLNHGNKPIPTCATSSFDSSAPQDPRLRKASVPSATPSLYKIPQIPSLMQSHIGPPVGQTHATLPTRPTNIPSLLDVVGLFSHSHIPPTGVPPRHGPTEFNTNVNRHFERSAAKQTTRSGYSSEDNWDSDPEIPPLLKVATQVPNTTQSCGFREYPKSKDGHVESVYKHPTKSPLLSTPILPAFGGPNTGNLVPPYAGKAYHQLPASIPQKNNHCKFSAVLNDKTERYKYFESKKQKHNQPRTYVEYKKAKARAAAEEAARKAAEEAAKVSTDNSKDISEIGNSALAKLTSHPPTVSTLDKLYRSADFKTCEFPKPKTNFKIPKKAIEKTNDKGNDEGKPEEKQGNAKETTSERGNENQKKEEKGNCDAKLKLDQKEQPEGKNKVASKGQVPKKVHKSVDEKREEKNSTKDKVENGDENSEGKKIGDRADSKKDDVEVNKKNNEKVQFKHATKIEGIGKKVEEKMKEEIVVMAAVSTLDVNKDTQTRTESEGSVHTAIPMNEEKSISQYTPTKPADITTIECIKHESLGKPARILKRRNTMLVHGSIPEVDKQKIFSVQSLVYEDIQGAKEKERRNEMDSKLPKKNKCLAEIFQKTDDNCTVSTQNIISGKRRTRANVNFNEVQRQLEVFNHKRRSDPSKNIEKTPPSNKKPPTKGNKGTKGKAKNEIIHIGSEQTEEQMDEIKEKVLGKAEDERNPTNTLKTGAKMDEDAQKRHLLEGFVQDILNPDNDKEHIFSLLAQILSKENLKFVKEIVESAAKKNKNENEETNGEVGGNEEDNAAADDDMTTVNETEVNKESEKSTVRKAIGMGKVKRKVKAKRKKELDRLNEDIRDMFISKGVLTATGRRMCTLVAEVEQANREYTNTGEEAETVDEETEFKGPLAPTEQVQTLPRIRKSKVILRAVNVKDFQQPAKIRSISNNVEKDKDLATISRSETATEKMGDAKKHSDESPSRTMPVLKPHTPIKQSEVDDEPTEQLVAYSTSKKRKVEDKVKKHKPGPKSKKVKSAIIPEDEQNDNIVDTSVIVAAKPIVVKNTNQEWHSQSKWVKRCVLCDIKITFPGIHYKQNHDEYYTSRLSPDVLNQLKMGKMSKPFFGVTQKKLMYWSYRCPFCLQHNRTLQSSWTEHFVIHTGEYFFECERCHRSVNKASQLECHVKTQCIGASIVRNRPLPPTSVLRAHICHLCNYIQFHRQNLDRHFVNQHDINSAEIDKLGYTIDLFDIRDVKIVDALKALELEAEILNENVDVARCNNDASEKQINVTNEQMHSSEMAINPEKNESKNDQIPITKSAVELALNSNIFVPTRETNESPTMNNFAQNFFTIENEQRPSIGSGGATNIVSGISMAERLSQRFKIIQNRTESTCVTDKAVTTKTTSAVEANAVRDDPSKPKDTVTHNQLNLSTEIISSISSTTESIATENPAINELVTSAAQNANDSHSEDDDENWEDIEITESAPSTTSSVASPISNSISKGCKSRNKNVFQKFNRLYATNNKLKKSLSITVGSRKKQADDKKEAVLSKPVNNADPVNSATIPTVANNTGSPALPTDTANEAHSMTNCTTANAESKLPFRPLITNLDDLLPDSPCNDPIELVPELTPIESLQDLCDISSILSTDYISNNWEQNHGSIGINNDSQQANMQEALDFVKEQQHKQCVTPSATVGNTNTQTVALTSIHRIENIGYSKSVDDNSFKFYCLSENCTFLYSSEAIGLESHFSCEHVQTFWNGYCHSCKVQVEGDASTGIKLPLAAELRHMREKHLSVSDMPVVPVIDQMKQPSKSNSPALDEERPRIKIRRLTGDCLSTTPTPTSSHNAKTVSTFDENAQLFEMVNLEPPPRSSISTSFLNTIPTIPATDNTVENRHFQNIGTPIIIPSPAPPDNVISTTEQSCQLQISNVVSLNENSSTEPNASAVQLPVISNVCSLNTRSVSSPANNTGALWAQHIANERVELERSAAESMEVSHILANVNSSSIIKPGGEKASRTDSPGPQVVAETMPVAQATAGNYLITQTVSAQYEEGHLGFNISIAANPSVRLSCSDSSSSTGTSAIGTPTPQFKCMANGCKYQTRLTVAMRDHLRFHDSQNFSAQREYLRCSKCSYLAEDVDGFMRHTELTHVMMIQNSTDAETIRGILRNTESNCSQRGLKTGAAGTDPQATDGNNETDVCQTFTKDTWEIAIKEIVAATGVPDSKLYRCNIEDCKTTLTEANYYSHVVYHLSTLGYTNINNHSYKCPHCKQVYYKPQKIKAHIKTHGTHKFFCYLCMSTAISTEQIHKHFEERHWRIKKLRCTMLPLKASDGPSSIEGPIFFVVFTRLLDELELQLFREKLVAEWQRKKASSRTHFKPTEIGLLPLTPIFGRDLNCAVCPYKTKVRTNLMRHLQMHTDDSNGGSQQLANVDPVNPVPCLNSSEKHFDKMTNLASSSLVVPSTSGNGPSGTSSSSSAANVNSKGKVIYEYVPEMKRYTCGVTGCQYLTISDDIFRSHLNALHSEILNYNCAHCKEEVCKRNMSIERILNHLRFHGPKLYQCELCGYLHYMRTVVERHIRQHDVQPPLFVKVIEHDRTKESSVKKCSDSATPESLPPSKPKQDTSKSKGKHKWTCNLCGHNTMTQPQIVAHASIHHACKHQYQCMHCAFGAAQLVQIMSHIDEKHAGKKREARYVFQKLDKQEDSGAVNATDTRPLWQRDDPTRVRHIRGILMEDEEESERYQKRLCLDDNDDGVDADEGDEPSRSERNLYLGLFGFLCYYCNKQCANPKDLYENHWQASNCKSFDSTKIFRYRICTQLKCPHCLSFMGHSFELIEHMKVIHKATRYLAADPHTTTPGLTCGHCEYHSQSLAQLAQHTSRLRHKPLDLKDITLTQLEKVKKLGTIITYVQCINCMELFASQSAFVSHASLVHANECDVRSRELKNTLIYSCPICAYASIHELMVLRHMINHYGGFKRCYYCGEPQTTFNGYMQHCYSDHREEIKHFCNIYTYTEISRYLQQMQLIFPNGLTVDLYNLRLTQCLREYGNKHIKLLYDEILKTSQQPPIPRLSLGRLVARKSIEAKKTELGAISPAATATASASTAAAMQLAGNRGKAIMPAFTTQKIMKRRSTVALGRDEAAVMAFDINSMPRSNTASIFNGKKRKIEHNFELLSPPVLNSITAPTSGSERQHLPKICDNGAPQSEKPFSFYGQPSVPLNLNKIFVKIAATDTVETKVSVAKFKLLCNIMPRVLVEPTDMKQYRKRRKTVKPCPASHKFKYS